MLAKLTRSYCCCNVEDNCRGGAKVQAQDQVSRAFGQDVGDFERVLAELIGDVGNSMIAELDFTEGIQALEYKP